MKKIQYQDANISDKSDIIRETQNTELLKKLLGDNIPISKDENLLHLVPPQFINPNYDETEKFGIIFSAKAGSSLIDGIMEQYDISVLNDFSDKKWSKHFHAFLSATFNESHTFKTWNEFTNICQGKSKKDLIIVMRNPIYKWLSGLWMDINTEVETSKILYSYLKEKYNIENNDTDSKVLNSDAIKDVVYKYLRESMEVGDGISHSHSLLFNETYYNFLTNNNIDKTKLRIIDIDEEDSDLLNLFNQYYPEIEFDESTRAYWTLRGIHKEIIEGLIETTNKDSMLLNTIRNILTRDLYYYTLIKEKYRDNFVK